MYRYLIAVSLGRSWHLRNSCKTCVESRWIAKSVCLSSTLEKREKCRQPFQEDILPQNISINIYLLPQNTQYLKFN